MYYEIKAYEKIPVRKVSDLGQSGASEKDMAIAIFNSLQKEGKDIVKFLETFKACIDASETF